MNMNADNTQLQPDSWLVTAGRSSEPGSPLNVPLVPASNFIIGGKREYSRDDGTPTWAALEQLVGGLESGRSVAFASGMAAIAAVFDQLHAGATVVLPDDCYQGVAGLVTAGADRGRWSVQRVALHDTAGWIDACRTADLVWLESPSNPLLGVADLEAICAAPRKPGSIVAVDNTFATPLLCRPLELGADLVLESITKMMNGHSDVILGMLAGRAAGWERVPRALSAWGLASAPFECWLAARGLATMAVRMDRAFDNALRAARLLASRSEVRLVDYPGLESHPQHELARSQLAGRYGSIVTFHLPGGTPVATAFLRAARRIPFCPSLGEVATTISHPESTSHRALSVADRAALGIDGGTLRLSVGIESSVYIEECLLEGLAAAAQSGAA